VSLSEFLAKHYKSITPIESFSEQKMIKASEKPLQSACVIALCLHRSPENLIPGWEETAALSCATQNIWLSASALGIGAYWSTPSAIYKMNDFLKLQEFEECLGLFYMGWKDEISLPAERWSLDKVVREL
jgi:nitroreductase